MILLRTPGAAAVLSPTATYGRHRCPFFCARRFDDLPFINIIAFIIRLIVNNAVPARAFARDGLSRPSVRRTRSFSGLRPTDGADPLPSEVSPPTPFVDRIYRPYSLSRSRHSINVLETRPRRMDKISFVGCTCLGAYPRERAMILYIALCSRDRTLTNGITSPTHRRRRGNARDVRPTRLAESRGYAP